METAFVAEKYPLFIRETLSIAVDLVLQHQKGLNIQTLIPFFFPILTFIPKTASSKSSNLNEEDVARYCVCSLIIHQFWYFSFACCLHKKDILIPLALIRCPAILNPHEYDVVSKERAFSPLGKQLLLKAAKMIRELGNYALDTEGAEGNLYLSPPPRNLNLILVFLSVHKALQPKKEFVRNFLIALAKSPSGNSERSLSRRVSGELTDDMETPPLLTEEVLLPRLLLLHPS